MRILIVADDYWALEDVITIILNSDPSWVVVGVASDGIELEKK